MKLRAKLARQVAPFLAPGEQLQAVFRAQSCFGLREARTVGLPLWHLIVVTDREILVLDLSLFKCRPTRVRLRESRNVYFGCSRRFTFGNQNYWVSSDVAEEIAAVDTALVDMLRHELVDEVRLASRRQTTMRTVPVSWPVEGPSEGDEESARLGFSNTEMARPLAPLLKRLQAEEEAGSA